MPSTHHIYTWVEELVDYLFLSPVLNFLPKKLEVLLDILVEKFFVLFRLVSPRDDFTTSDIPPRTACFINEARKHGIKFKVLRGPFGYTNHFQMQTRKKIFHFEGLPRAEFLSKDRSHIVSDKETTKQHLKKGNFPIAPGKSFWFFQKKKAYRYGANQLGFPLVVKPRGGSVSRHVTTNIESIEQLKYAIKKSIIYSPAFIIEKFIPDTFVYRATVIDFDFVACVQQIPANVMGNGVSTIRQLIDKKNNDPRRNKLTHYKIVEDEVTENLLANIDYNFSTVPPKDEVVYLQKNPFLKLGGDLVEVTPRVHPDNLQLFREAAKLFAIRVVGIDFLTQDIR